MDHKLSSRQESITNHKNTLQDADTHVYVSGCDIDGITRGKLITRDKFLHSQDGFGFCSVLFGWDLLDHAYHPKPPFMAHSDSYGDLLAMIDMDSMRRIPWSNTPHYLVNFHDPATSNPLDFCPRSLLKKTLLQLSNAGFPTALVGMEFEFYNYKETPDSLHQKKGVNLSPLSTGMFGYSMTRTHYQKNYHAAIYKGCTEYGIPIEGFHTETGPGVYEAALEYTTALEMAVKQIGLDHGVIPCFMAKPYQDQPGCSGAPLTVSYGVQDRNAAVRLIRGQSSRIEVRVPGADVNPYLAISALIACGLHGIQNKLKPVVGERLPRNLADATAKIMERDSVARTVLGDGFVDHYGATRLNEVRVWNTAVTDWELKRYMETV